LVPSWVLHDHFLFPHPAFDLVAQVFRDQVPSILVLQQILCAAVRSGVRQDVILFLNLTSADGNSFWEDEYFSRKAFLRVHIDHAVADPASVSDNSDEKIV